MPNFTTVTDTKSAFQREGYAVARGVLGSDEAAALAERVDRYVDQYVPTMDPMHFFCEDKSDLRTLFRLEKMDGYDPFFAELIEQFTAPAADLLDDAASPRSVEMFGKAPKVGQPTPPHQDGNYFKIEPNEALTFWIAVDPVDQDNGCIRYVPGSHRRGMRPHALSDAFGFSLGIEDYSDADSTEEVAVTAAPGDVAIHHSMTIHRADANPSSRLRRAIGLVFYAGRAEKDVAAEQAHKARIKQKWQDEGHI